MSVLLSSLDFFTLMFCFSVLLLFISKVFVFSIGSISRSTFCIFSSTDLIKPISSAYLGLIFIL